MTNELHRRSTHLPLLTVTEGSHSISNTMLAVLRDTLKLNDGWNFDVETQVGIRRLAGFCRALAKVCAY